MMAAGEEQSSVKNKLLRLYHSKRFADFILIGANNREYLVHKWVLEDSCDYFKNLFAMEPTVSSLAFPEDMSNEAIEAFVKFLYTNELSTEHSHENQLAKESNNSFKKDDIICQLFEVADYFQCHSLLRMTVNCLERTLSLASVNHFMNFFKHHPNHPELQRILVAFISQNHPAPIKVNVSFHELGPILNEAIKGIGNHRRIKIPEGAKFSNQAWRSNFIARWFGDDLMISNNADTFLSMSNEEVEKLLSKQQARVRFINYNYGCIIREMFGIALDQDTILFSEPTNQATNVYLFKRVNPGP